MTGEFGFRLLDTPVVVRSASEEALQRVGACYRGVDGAGEEALAAAIEPDGEGWRVVVEGRPRVSAADLTAAVRALNHELMHALMVRHRHLFFVHAGVVAFGGRAIVLPGLSRAGKSTLVLALVQAGAALLSDELLAYDPEAGLLRAFPRAVKVRDECVGYFPAFAGRFVGSGEGRFLPLGVLGDGGVAGSARPGLVVAPRWDALGDDEPRPIRPGEGLLWLVRSALNFGSQRERSIDHLAALAGQSRCFELAWRDPHAAARVLRERVEEVG
ncbi:MAG TPA: hypothetical protein VK081_12230 [Planctomycetota bacterium]|nr:hypothetical protein [Planctomycetota bacterium]